MNIKQLLTSVSGMSLAAAARQYASHQVPVFPCVPGEKRPLVAHGFQDASHDLAQVEAWWRRWPDANIGIPTGPVSGFEVVDVDVKGDDPRGPGSWHDATRQGLLGGWVAHVVTPSGGLHAYYPASETQQRSWASARAQIDFRGTAGYIIAPPSRVQIGDELVPYQLLELSTKETRPVNAGMLRDFLDPRPIQPVGAGQPFRGTLAERAERIAAWLAGQTEGERNQGLFWASCRLAENGAGLRDTFEALGPVAEQLGLPPREIERTIRSAINTHHTAPAHSTDRVAAQSTSVQREAKGRVLA